MSKQRRIDGPPTGRVRVGIEEKSSLTSKEYTVAVLLKIMQLPLDLVRMILDLNKLPEIMISRGSGAIRGHYDSDLNRVMMGRMWQPRYFTPIVETRFNPNHSSFQPAPYRRIDRRMSALFNAPTIEELED